VVVVDEMVEDSFDDVQLHVKKENTSRYPTPKMEGNLSGVFIIVFIFFN
jgi:hypothetical protein